MRSGVVLALVLGACGFQSSRAAGDGPPPRDASPDVPDAPGVLPDAAIDGGPASTSFCDRNDPKLVACYEFEGDASDASSHGLDAAPIGVLFVPGKVGLAMQFAVASSANVPASSAFTVPALTLEAWIFPTALPLPGAQSDIIDVNSQYDFQINPDGTMTCDLHGAPKVSTMPSMTKIAPGQWAHVACTYDGSSVSRSTSMAPSSRARRAGAPWPAAPTRCRSPRTIPRARR